MSINNFGLLKISKGVDQLILIAFIFLPPHLIFLFIYYIANVFQKKFADIDLKTAISKCTEFMKVIFKMKKKKKHFSIMLFAIMDLFSWLLIFQYKIQLNYNRIKFINSVSPR